jgi:oxygen-independent coproporphyrinogen-3 oxidase
MTQVSSLYLHVPFCKHLCNYCDFYKRQLDPTLNQFEEFHQFLQSSLSPHQEFLQQHHFSWAPLETIYLGGGTPSLWGEGGAKFFPKLLSVPLAAQAEFTMEIDPGTWTPQMLQAWQEIGLNRISIGTQTLNPYFLKVMDRIHSVDDTLNFLTFLHQEKWNFSLDFLLGIPFSRSHKRDIKQELDTLLAYQPKHISLYILNARSRYPHVQDLPDDEYIREEYLFVSEYLRAQGFHHYEVSNFALPGFESRHNQKYWQGESVAALGPTGTGYLNLSSDAAIRYKWKVSEAKFEEERLGLQELKLEKTYLTLRTSAGLEMAKGMESLLEQWQKQSYAVLEKNKIKLTALGYLMLDSLMDDLFKWEASLGPSK